RDESLEGDEETVSVNSKSDDESPNITPASLRSANRKQSQTLLKQTKLPFQRLSLPSLSTPKLAASKPKAKKDVMEISDSEPEDEDMELEDGSDEQEIGEGLAKEAASKLKGKKKAHAPAPRSLHKTGTGALKPVNKKALKGKLGKRA
ncbi:hypothetical protein DM02DRAFT_665531, partial [Periconia macrospinosa]